MAKQKAKTVLDDPTKKMLDKLIRKFADKQHALNEAYNAKMREDVLQELDYFYGDRTETMKMILGRFLIRLIGPEVEHLSSVDVILLWLRHAQTKRDAAEKLGRLQEYKDTWGYGLVPIIGQTELFPYDELIKQIEKVIAARK